MELPHTRPGADVSLGRLTDPRRRSLLVLLREVVLVAFAILLYFAVRNFTAGSEDAAFANADSLIAVEDDLGIRWEDTLQDATVSRDPLVTLANWVYIFGHWPVILGVATALYTWRRRHYYLLRNAMFASGLIGFFLFALFPVAPPRLLDLGLLDTVTERSDAYRALQPPGLTNQFAAFPSLHAGWNLLVGIVVIVAVSTLAVRLVALTLPVAMGLAVVVTGNHFVIDIVAGMVVVLIGLAIAVFVERRQDASTLRPDGASWNRGGRPSDSAVRRGASGGELPRETA